MKKLKKMAVPIAYPRCIVMDTASPAVSPRVVAQILMTQKPNVISETLFKVISVTLFIGFRPYQISPDVHASAVTRDRPHPFGIASAGNAFKWRPPQGKPIASTSR